MRRKPSEISTKTGTKICKTCGLEKSLNDFRYRKQHNGKYYYEPYCKLCEREDNKRRGKKRYEEKGQQEFKEWYSDPDNKESRRIYNQEYHKKNTKKRKEYRQSRKEEYRIVANEWRKNEWHKNPAFKLRSKISGAVNRMLKLNNSTKKNNSVLKYLPYKISELKTYIESKFEDWMTWDNWGLYDAKNWDDNDSSTWTWQLDHIIPCCKLPYNSMEHKNFVKCWALSNLRPLSAKENVVLGCKIPRSESKIRRHK